MIADGTRGNHAHDIGRGVYPSCPHTPNDKTEKQAHAGMYVFCHEDISALVEYLFLRISAVSPDPYIKDRLQGFR